MTIKAEPCASVMISDSYSAVFSTRWFSFPNACWIKWFYWLDIFTMSCPPLDVIPAKGDWPPNMMRQQWHACADSPFNFYYDILEAATRPSYRYTLIITRYVEIIGYALKSRTKSSRMAAIWIYNNLRCAHQISYCSADADRKREKVSVSVHICIFIMLNDALDQEIITYE